MAFYAARRGFRAKSFFREQRNQIYESLNKNIFKQLKRDNLEGMRDYPLNRLKLNYQISALSGNAEYEEARRHWQMDLPDSVRNPEEIELDIKNLNTEVDQFFTETIQGHVRTILEQSG